MNGSWLHAGTIAEMSRGSVIVGETCSTTLEWDSLSKARKPCRPPSLGTRPIAGSDRVATGCSGHPSRGHDLLAPVRREAQQSESMCSRFPAADSVAEPAD